ncbi:hypothetical protein [Desulfonatronovibrio magnus]|uniref:hypothetical protein n=1 Tax=Desulfonatronovibrio magnus TaxID=698827 RepID=UPI0005EB12D4|nr:hypothetical protein [Desulfonatronovibrio magnus]
MAEPVFSADQVNYLKEQMPLWLAEQSIGKPPAVYEIELRERMIRVEEELKYQREMIRSILTQMEKRFEQSDKRYEELRLDMNARFEQVDKRFEQVDKRFEQVDRRFVEMREDMSARFEQVDKRFEEMRMDMNARFEQVDKRFEALTSRIDRFMIWSFGTSLTMAAIIIGVLKYT